MSTGKGDYTDAFSPVPHASGLRILLAIGFPDDPQYCYRLLKSLYGMPSAARAWFHTISTFLKQEGCTKVGYEESMWKTTINGHDILLAAHIDDFLLACRRVDHVSRLY